MFLQRDVFVLYPGKHFNKLLRGFLDDAVDIDQSLVGVVDDATDFRIGLSYSEEEGAATDKRFYIGIHLSEPEMKETELVEGLLDIFSLESYPYPADDLTQSPYGKKKKRKRRGPHLG